MNNFPFQIPPYLTNNSFYNIIEELNQLKKRIDLLEEKMKKKGNEKEYNYLKKDDNYYMI